MRAIVDGVGVDGIDRRGPDRVPAEPQDAARAPAEHPAVGPVTARLARGHVDAVAILDGTGRTIDAGGALREAGGHLPPVAAGNGVRTLVEHVDEQFPLPVPRRR
jgi:hypothetical protein